MDLLSGLPFSRLSVIYVLTPVNSWNMYKTDNTGNIRVYIFRRIRATIVAVEMQCINDPWHYIFGVSL